MDMIHVTITGLMLILILLINNDFHFDADQIEEWLLLYSILLLTIIGGLLGIYRKKKRKATSNTRPSPPDNLLQ